MSQYKFESKEYPIIEHEKNAIRFFNSLDSNLYQIQPNTQEEIKSNKGECSLWNLSKNKRVSGLYLKSSKNQIKQYIFDYMDQVYYLEITKDSILIQFLHLKGGSIFSKKKPKSIKQPQNGLVVGLW